MVRGQFTLSQVRRRVAWAGILACVAFGPTSLAVKPGVTRSRISRNEWLAAARVRGLKESIVKTIETDGSGQICDSAALQTHYKGPQFRDGNWRRIIGNSVQEDGYELMTYCHEKGGGYTIAAVPGRQGVDGTRGFCSDESSMVGCHVEFDGSRHKCLPCPMTPTGR